MMWTRKMKTPILWIAAVSILALGLAFACTSDSPSEPRSDPPNPPGTGGGDFVVTVSVSTNRIQVGSEDRADVRILVRRRDNNAPPADGSTVLVTASLGQFGSPTSGQNQATLTLVGGQALARFFAGDEAGTAIIQAQFQGSVGQATIELVGQATFFLSFVEPNTGSPSGGEEVTIRGGGFVRPLRVVFSNSVARILSSATNRIRVVVPEAPQAVPAGTTLPVDVTVTTRFNQEGQQTDSLSNGFTYVPGGGPVQQPVVFTVDPPSGPNEGGTRVTLTGERFAAPVQVLFGQGSNPDSFSGVEATVESVTANRIVVITPSAGGFGIDNRNQLVAILVRNINSGFATIVQSAFQYLTPFRISGITPLEGPATGGQAVSVFGSGFRQPLQVTIGQVGSAEEVEQQVLSVEPQEVRFRTASIDVEGCPAGGVALSAPVNVRIFDEGNADSSTVVSSDQVYRYLLVVPQVFGLAPTAGPQAGGTDVTITGSGFSAPVRVTLTTKNETFVAQVISVTPTSILIRTPAVTDLVFDEIPCGVDGMQYIPTAFDVLVENLETGCVSDALPNAFTYAPTNSLCRQPPPPPPEPPLADFSTSINNLTVIFNNLSTGTAPLSYRWTFGDGSPLSLQSDPVHTYAAPGTYAVTLTVTNAGGSDSASQFVTVPPP